MDTPGLNDLLKAILNSRSGDTIPSGWYTAEQIAKQAGLKKSTTSKLLTDSLETGTIERKKFRIINKGRMRSVFFYKQKKQGKA